MLQNEPSREDFNCRKRRTTATTIEVITKEDVNELKEMYANLSDRDFNSKIFDMSPLLKMLQGNSRNRTDKFSAALWTDLVIEQTMMRSL